MLSESFALEDTAICDETSKDTAVAGPSPVGKRVHFAVSLVGRCVCPRSSGRQYACVFHIASN